MKRLIAMLCLLCLCAAYALPAFAADGNTKDPTGVTITVVLPDPAPSEEPAPEPPSVKVVFPCDVTDIRENGEWHIVKTYELRPGEKPEDIPTGSFERGGWVFTLTDIIRKETAAAETRGHTETVTVDTETKELETILPLLPQTMEYRAEDGFVGILTLDVSSIKVETAGTRTSSYTMSVTREYPRLSNTDTANIPKTVTDRGTTYTLAGVEWRSGNNATVDYTEMPEYYTAVATYTASGTSTKVTGYTTTAEYSGTLARLSQGKTFYTAYFIGEAIRTPLDMIKPTPKPTPSPTNASNLRITVVKLHKNMQDNLRIISAYAN